MEIDPTGRGPHELGAKLDGGKIRADLLLDFRHALREVARVSTFGAQKYAPGSWLHVPDGEVRYRAARLRHQLEEGEDDDSGLLHLAHEAWNILAELELRLRREVE